MWLSLFFIYKESRERHRTRNFPASLNTARAVEATHGQGVCHRIATGDCGCDDTTSATAEALRELELGGPREVQAGSTEGAGRLRVLEAAAAAVLRRVNVAALQLFPAEGTFVDAWGGVGGSDLCKLDRKKDLDCQKLDKSEKLTFCFS